MGRHGHVLLQPILMRNQADRDDVYGMEECANVGTTPGSACKLPATHGLKSIANGGTTPWFAFHVAQSHGALNTSILYSLIIVLAMSDTS